ncbi:hypothetical protein CAK95_01115 [Pseudorhodoplanes sinuspersici]|uniref:Uncharacterized protein n=1 Tax=Pseudorhodoplanes sinuspersici TaxID=1235591 RepID=A0A1W6ZKQ7_9HYPH|nr:hypothetical protein CAK95_01115 [Pseudorhodoplanes sinuspersici]
MMPPKLAHESEHRGKMVGVIGVHQGLFGRVTLFRTNQPVHVRATRMSMPASKWKERTALTM